MRRVWIISDAIVSPLGNTSEENFKKLASGVSGLRAIHDEKISNKPIYAGRIDDLTQGSLTRFESMCSDAIQQAVGDITIAPERTLFVLSTTKGNIAELGLEHPRLSLFASANLLASLVGFQHVQVVSNACVSGVMAVTIATRFLRSGKYDHAVVVGADELSSFVVSGFQSLAALSDEQCRPFDAARKGINLGEAAAAVVLSVDPSKAKDTAFEVLGAGLSNDANHISGPSRTGAELAQAIRHALQESNLSAGDIDFVSAHGTATMYNDEMESKAFHIAGLAHTPVHSLKPHYGHTLGAAGVVEIAASIHSVKQNCLLPTLGFETSGVSAPLNVIRRLTDTPLKNFIKTASGFGGCNAAIVIQKSE